MQLDGILFDKDGTLFDFASTWNLWTATLIEDLSRGDAQLAQSIAQACHYDLETRSFAASSPIIAGTHRQAAECVASALPDRSVDDIEDLMMYRAAEVPQQPPVPLDPLLAGLASAGRKLGVMTNDSEYAARRHLTEAGVIDRFDFIAGFDSGHGAKPSPGPLLAFAQAMAIVPDRVAMVGDSTHDLIAGRSAGMVTVAVLTGLADADELAPYADVILPHIGHIPDWLAG